MSISDRMVVVTGANGALGSVVCGLLRKEGANVFEITREVADLTDEGQVEKAYGAAARKGAIHGSVHLAGAWMPGGTTEAFETMIAVNLRSAVLCCNAALKRMAPDGRIVNVASITAATLSSLSGSTAYNIAKSGVITLTKAIAEAGKVRCNCVAPAAMRTPKNPPAPGQVPVEDVAEAIVYLLSPEAPNGAVLTFPAR